MARINGLCKCLFESLIKIVDKILRVFQSDGQSDRVYGESRYIALLVCEFTVRRLCGIDDEGSCVADVCLISEDAYRFNELSLLFFGAGKLKGKDSACAVRKILVCKFFIFAALSVRVADPVYMLVCLKILNDLDCGRSLLCDSLGERLDAEKDEVCVKR